MESVKWLPVRMDGASAGAVRWIEGERARVVAIAQVAFRVVPEGGAEIDPEEARALDLAQLDLRPRSERGACSVLVHGAPRDAGRFRVAVLRDAELLFEHARALPERAGHARARAALSGQLALPSGILPGDWVEVAGVGAGLLRFHLPTARPVFELRGERAIVVEDVAPIAIVLDVDRLVLVVTWRADAELAHAPARSLVDGRAMLLDARPRAFTVELDREAHSTATRAPALPFPEPESTRSRRLGGRLTALPFEPTHPGASPWARYAGAPSASGPEEDASFVRVTRVPSEGDARRVWAPKTAIPARTSESVPVVSGAGTSHVSAFSVRFRLRPEVDSLVVIAKASFDWLPGEVLRAAEEADPPTGDVFGEDDRTGPLVYPSDFALMKPRADVVLRRSPDPAAEARTIRLQFGEPESGVDRTAARAALGPISPADPSRASKLGTYDERWSETRWPWLPDDFDWSHFQAAPEAQQVEAIRGDEGFRVEGLDEDAPWLDGWLSGARVAMFVQRTADAGGFFERIDLRLDTVVLDCDAMKVHAVFRGAIDVAGEHAPDVAALFVATEPCAEPLLIEDAQSKFAATLAADEGVDAPLADEPTIDGSVAPANDVDAEVEANLAAAEADLRARLERAGVPLPAPGGDAPDAPTEAPDFAAIAAKLREAGAPGEIMAALAEAGTPPAPDAEVEAEPRGRALAERLLASGADLDDVDLREADLRGLDFTGKSLRRALLGGADLRGVALERANLTDVDAADARLDDAKLAGACLEGASFERVHGPRVDLRGVEGAGVVFTEASLPGARLDGASLGRADFSSATLDHAVLDDAVLPAATFYDARLAFASLARADLTNARADGVVAVRASFVDARAPESSFERAILDDADLSGAVLRHAGFVQASLRGANVRGVDLAMARMKRADLSGALLSGTNLMRASLERSDLSRSDLRGANLHGADLFCAVLDGAAFDDDLARPPARRASAGGAR